MGGEIGLPDFALLLGRVADCLSGIFQIVNLTQYISLFRAVTFSLSSYLYFLEFYRSSTTHFPTFEPEASEFPKKDYSAVFGCLRAASQTSDVCKA